MLELLRRGLIEEGHSVICAVDGCEALLNLREQEFDVRHPRHHDAQAEWPRAGISDACREELCTPIVMLTAKDTVPDIINGLDLGADDYMTKPFSFGELLLRLRAVRRRASICQTPKLQVKDLWFDITTHQVSRAGESITLTRTEYSLLERLMSNAGRSSSSRNSRLVNIGPKGSNRSQYARCLYAFIAQQDRQMRS